MAWPHTEASSDVGDLLNAVFSMTDSQVERYMQSTEHDKEEQLVQGQKRGGTTPAVQVLSLGAYQSFCEDGQQASPLLGAGVLCEMPEEELD